MCTFTPVESAACSALIEMALSEDLGVGRTCDADVTSACFVDASARGITALVARTPGVLAGLDAVKMVFARVDASLKFDSLIQDGTTLSAGDRIAVISGSTRSILAGERTALNFLQYLSGIATATRQYVHAVAGYSARILDTRKTLPGWRLLAKYAVRQGGGHNHRMGLYDMALIKDNHWAARPADRTLLERVKTFQDQHPGISIEIEVDTLRQFDETLIAKPDIILLDNMSLDMMREAVRRRNANAPGILLEASGGVNLQTVRGIAETGVDRISVGALTHSVTALDIALDYDA